MTNVVSNLPKAIIENMDNCSTSYTNTASQFQINWHRFPNVVPGIAHDWKKKWKQEPY